MAKNKKINVEGIEITVIRQNNDDFISLTDMTSTFKEGPGLIGKWVTNKNTLEYLGIWEKINNQGFNYPEFGVIEKEAGTNRFIMSVGQWVQRTNAVGVINCTAKEWRNDTPGKEGNMRDYATLEQLVVLANLESMNALFIRQQIPQSQRLVLLNEQAIQQMKSILSVPGFKKLQ